MTLHNGRLINLECADAVTCESRPPLKVSETTPGRGPVTIRDIAAFHPIAGATQLEPDGWAVRGLEANPFSSANRHEVSGTLLGRPAVVRFTPTNWHWDYGDGGSRDSTSAGASWKSLGVPEFSRTVTSHVYEEAGAFTVTPGIRFTAEYRFADEEWTGIAGSVTIAGPSATVHVATASTVLVGADCAAEPAAPGC